MGLFKSTLALLCSTFVAGSAYACSDDRDPTQPVIFLSSTLDLCAELVHSVDELVNDLLYATKLKQKTADTHLDYWSEWVLKNVDDPMFTQKVDQSYFGVGVYRPYDLTLNDSELSYEELLKTYGVQLSLGIGAKNKNEPRVRLDYQWHLQHEDVMHVQIEVPF